MTLLAVRSYPAGPRVWVAGQRVHHGATGAILAVAAAALHRRRLALLGLALCAHDRHDLRVWFVRECLPAVSVDSELSRP